MTQIDGPGRFSNRNRGKGRIFIDFRRFSTTEVDRGRPGAIGFVYINHPESGRYLGAVNLRP